MPVCPECHRTWPAGVVLCRDCRATLVEAGEQGAAGAGDRDESDESYDSQDAGEWVSLVPLRDVPDPVIAALWQGALESQGLHPVVRSRTLPGYGQILQGWNSPAWGELLVPEDELAEAQVVLADFIAAAANSPLAEDEEP